MNAPQTTHERFCSLMAHLAAQRPADGSVQLYERLKRQYQQDVPDASPQQYAAAMQAIARAAGV